MKMHDLAGFAGAGLKLCDVAVDMRVWWAVIGRQNEPGQGQT
jgi:hypothetical protein